MLNCSEASPTIVVVKHLLLRYNSNEPDVSIAKESELYQIDEVSRKVASNKQEAVRVGQVIVLSQDDQEVLRQLQHHFLARGYRVCGTRHFVVCQKSSSRYTVLMHQFRQ